MHRVQLAQLDLPVGPVFPKLATSTSSPPTPSASVASWHNKAHKLFYGFNMNRD